jgi:hypothetical protein
MQRFPLKQPSKPHLGLGPQADGPINVFGLLRTQATPPTPNHVWLLQTQATTSPPPRCVAPRHAAAGHRQLRAMPHAVTLAAPCLSSSCSRSRTSTTASRRYPRWFAWFVVVSCPWPSRRRTKFDS